MQARKVLETPPASLNSSPTYSLDGLARKTPGLRRFGDCIEAAGLADAFANKGPFTVFAPNDDAFDKLPPEALDALMRDSAKLKAILNYHVINGFQLIRELKSGAMLTVQGGAIAVVVSDEHITLNEARIAQTDMTAINGVVHTIDALLLPPKWRLPGISRG